MSDLLITVLSLVGGAVLASISGIIVTTCVDCRKEEKQMKAFKLELRLHIKRIYEKLDEFKELNKSNDLSRADEYISKTFIDNPILKDYQKIALIPKININLYFDIITELEDIDRLILSMIESQEEQNRVAFQDNLIDTYYMNPVWRMIDNFVDNHLRDIKDIMELLE